jgi:hypothetical protein
MVLAEGQIRHRQNRRGGQAARMVRRQNWFPTPCQDRLRPEDD